MRGPILKDFNSMFFFFFFFYHHWVIKCLQLLPRHQTFCKLLNKAQSPFGARMNLLTSLLDIPELKFIPVFSYSPPKSASGCKRGGCHPFPAPCFTPYTRSCSLSFPSLSPSASPQRTSQSTFSSQVSMPSISLPTFYSPH